MLERRLNSTKTPLHNSNPTINTELAHFIYTRKCLQQLRKYTILTGTNQTNTCSLVSKQKSIEQTIKQHRNVKHVTPILKTFNTSRPPRRDITAGRLGYKTQKSHPRVSQSVDHHRMTSVSPRGTLSSHRAAKVGISGIKGCSLHQDFYVSTRHYWRSRCGSKLTVPTLFSVDSTSDFHLNSFKSTRPDR